MPKGRGCSSEKFWSKRGRKEVGGGEERVHVTLMTINSLPNALIY